MVATKDLAVAFAFCISVEWTHTCSTTLKPHPAPRDDYKRRVHRIHRRSFFDFAGNLFARSSVQPIKRTTQG